MTRGLLNRRRMMVGGDMWERVTFPTGAYIKTGITATGDTSAEIKFAALEIDPTRAFSFFGSRINLTSGNFMLLNSPPDNVMRYGYGYLGDNYNAGYYPPIVDLNAHTILMQKGDAYLDGNLIVTRNEQSFTGLEMYIGRFNNGGVPASRAFVIDVYYVKLWRAAQLVRDFIPYQISGVVGFLDIVNNTFHTNDGDGELVIH